MKPPQLSPTAQPSGGAFANRPHPLQPLFNPRSVALVGASDRPGSLGRVVRESLDAAGFAGPRHWVNPGHASIAGEPCYPSLEDVGEPVDLAVVTAPAPATPGIVEGAARAGVPAVLVLSAGFSETGDEGRKLEERLLAAAREGGVRLLGPNCLGLLRPSIGLNASFARTSCKPGNIALVSQSGAICSALVDWAATANVGFSSVVSLGAATDVDFGDVLDYLLFDPQTQSVLLYVEGVHHGRSFISALRAVARAKPVVVLKVGRHAAGSRAARSHTGALVGNDAVFDAVLARCGVVRVPSYGDLFAAARVLSGRHRPRGDRLAVVTNGGGPGVLAADALAGLGLSLPELAPTTLDALDQILPAHWSRGNPIDVIGDADGARFAGAASRVAADPNVDAVLTLYCPTAVSRADDVADALLPVAEASGKPLLTAWLGDGGVSAARRRIEQAGLPSYRSAEIAVEAFATLAIHARNQKLLLEAPPPRAQEGEHRLDVARRIRDAALASGRTLLNEVEAKALLAAFDIPVSRSIVAKSRAEAVTAASAIGYPVVMKVLSPDVSHKSDVEGVRLSVRDARQVSDQYDDIASSLKRLAPSASFSGVLVQSMVERRHGRELMVGVVRDPVFGPVISFGSGGIAVELLRDNAIGLPPLNVKLAGELIGRTRAAKLLGAYRNVPAANREALTEVLLRVSDLACAAPWVAEMDINPLLVDPSGAVALDARVVIDPVAREADERFSHLAIHPYPQSLEVAAQLRDGSRVTIRPIRPEDSAMETAFISHLSDESRYLRFLSMVRHVTPEMVARFTQIDYDREMALIGVRREADSESIIGVARYVRDPNPASAEFAIVVADSVQRQGLARQLMEQLMFQAKRAGIARLRGLVLSSNRPMLDFMRRLGFASGPAAEDHGLVAVVKML